MARYVVINSKKTPSVIDETDAVVYQTEYAGHAIDIIRDICCQDPQAEIHIYGGDGSIFEAVNAVMASGQAETATLVIHPYGTGNDFVRNFNEADFGVPQKIDLIRFDDKFAANEINVGFDCDVVARTQHLKKSPLIRGSLAYMISVLLTLFRPMGKHFDVSWTDQNGNTQTMQDKLLLCVVANGGYYGGGFCCAPRASLNDGLLEFLYVKKISRIKFLSFFLGYRKGKHINEDGTLHRKYADILYYTRVKSVTLRNVGNVCADGEIFKFDTLTVYVENQAICISVKAKAK